MKHVRIVMDFDVEDDMTRDAVYKLATNAYVQIEDPEYLDDDNSEVHPTISNLKMEVYGS